MTVCHQIITKEEKKKKKKKEKKRKMWKVYIIINCYKVLV